MLMKMALEKAHQVSPTIKCGVVLGDAGGNERFEN